MTNPSDALTQATRDALAAALQAAIDAHQSAHQYGSLAYRNGMRAALDIVKTTPVNLLAPDYSGAVVFPHGCRILGNTVDDAQPEYSRRMRDVTVERPFPYGDRVTVRTAVDFVPQLAASLAGHPEPHPEQGPAMPAAALCGDEGPGYPCVREPGHHGHHRDKFGNHAPLRYLDRAGDVWESDDASGGWLGLVVAGGRRVRVGPGGGRLRTDVEVTFGPLARVQTRRVVEVAEPVTAPADPALCGDVDGPRTCMSRPHHGHHVDGAGHEWAQWYIDGDSGDLWVSVDETGDRVRLVVVDRQHLGFDGASTLRGEAEQTHHGLTRVLTATVPAQFRQDPRPSQPAPAAPQLPGTVYVVSGGVAGEPHGAYADRDQAIAAARDLIREDADRPGVITWTFDDACGHATVHGPGPVVRITPVPLHAASHGLPVVGQDAVEAALDIESGSAEALATADDGPRCDNCHGPGPLVPHLYGMRVCQTCFPEPDAFVTPGIAPDDESTAVEIDGTGLSVEQRAGLACVECGAPLGEDDGDLVGRVAGGGEARQCLRGCDFDATGGAL